MNVCFDRIEWRPVKFVLSVAIAIMLEGCVSTSLPPKFLWGEPVATVWNFENDSAPFAASLGKGLLRFWDPDDTGWGAKKTKFGKASSFGLSPLPDGDANLIYFPATLPNQGYLLRHGADPNGVLAQKNVVSNYTIIMDILWPSQSKRSYGAIFQTDIQNKDLAEIYLDDNLNAGIGTNGRYNGEIKPNRWYRIAISVQAASGEGGVGQLHKFINGQFVGGHGTNSATSISRWALGSELLLFTDFEKGTKAGYLSSIYFVDRNLSMEEIANMGGPTAKGANIPHKIPKREVEKLDKKVGIAAHRGDSCCAPENTLAGIRQALGHGVEWIEVDVRWSEDNIPVLMHDEVVDRTTDGTGPIYKKSLREIKHLDAGSWFSPKFAGEKVPTLAEALMLTKGKARLILDVKGPKMGKVINEALNRAGVGPDAIRVWQNSAGKALADFVENIPGVKVFWGAVPKNLDDQTFNLLKQKGIAGFDLDIHTQPITKKFIKAAHKHQMLVSVYTVQDPPTMHKYAKLGVDVIETDFSATLQEMQP